MPFMMPKRSLPPSTYGRPPLIAEEQVLAEGQAAYRLAPVGGWRPAQVFLTDRRLLLYLRPILRAEVVLSSIVSMDMERHYCLLKERETLRILYRIRERKAKLWLVADHVGIWRRRIEQFSLLRVDQGTIQELLLRLDADGQEVLCHLWEKGHARIGELCDLIQAQDHEQILNLIRETINPAAEKLLGCPILSFERERVDSETGERVPYSWWLMGRDNCSRMLPSKERLVDVFEEGSFVRVILEVRNVGPSDLRIDLLGERLLIRCHKIGAALRLEIPLPVPVVLGAHEVQIRNNLLDLRLPKPCREQE